MHAGVFQVEKSLCQGRGEGEHAATKQPKEAVHRAKAKNSEVRACLGWRWGLEK